MKNKWGILIPTITGREEFLQSLLDTLSPQVEAHKEHVEIFIISDQGERNGGMTTGEKRNKLHDMARKAGCTHVSEIDDDDKVSDRYVEANLPGVLGDFDCNSLTGYYYENGRFVKPFVHDIKYKVASENERHYERFILHLNVKKLSLIEGYNYEHKSFGEDCSLYQKISNDGVFKTQYEVPEVVYYYYFRSKPSGI